MEFSLAQFAVKSNFYGATSNSKNKVWIDVRDFPDLLLNLDDILLQHDNGLYIEGITNIIDDTTSTAKISIAKVRTVCIFGSKFALGSIFGHTIFSKFSYFLGCLCL